jgi:hypothetical protein
MTKTLRSHFTNPETLFEIGHETVVQLLEPHRAFLRAKGFHLPARSAAATMDLERLAVLLSELDPQFPPELAEAMYLIDQASNPECGDRLHDASRARRDRRSQPTRTCRLPRWLLASG